MTRSPSETTVETFGASVGNDARPLRHHFTVDLEEYFHVAAMERIVPRADWERIEPRAARSTERLLELLEAHEARATFFVLGWLAERAGDLVRAIARAGHEVASHGWDHRSVGVLSPAEFRDSVRRSKALLEKLTGEEVVGFRAPNFSIVRGEEWALDVLLEEGYRYDSSLFPVRRSGYGYTGGPRDPHWLARRHGRLAEFPPATLRVAGMTLPAGGGGYLRLFPLALVRTALARAEARGVPATFYIHPWEWDPGQPRLAVPTVTRIRHYTGLHRTWGRIEHLLERFRFGTIRETLGASAP